MQQASMPTWQQRETRQAVAAWAASLAIHIVLILVLATVSWSAGLRPQPPQPQVRIIADDDVGMDSPPEVVAPSQPTVELSQPVKLAGPVQLSAVPKLTESAPSAPIEPLIGLDLAAGADAAKAGGNWAQLAAGGDAGHGAAEFFGLRATGGKFVFVIDKSGSMKGDRLDAAKKELFRSVIRLGEKMQYLIIFYDDQFHTMPARKLIRATRLNKRESLGWVGSVKGDGGTRPLEAMRLALSLRPDAVWLLSDGEFPEDYADEIHAANPESRTVIHTIAFQSRSGEAVLRRIARENGGQFRFVGPP